MPDSPPHGPGLRLRLLGEIAIERDGAALALPPSKKTRALLAYLAVVGRPQRRERLCEMLWEIPEDPRGALRWSLSKLRPLIDALDNKRILTDRDTVAIDMRAVEVDLFAARHALGNGVDGEATDRLVTVAEAFRGEFLEGLDLPACHGFQAWCSAEREDARLARVKILDALVRRFADEPEEALPFARTLVRIDVSSEEFRARLIGLLGQSGRREEAERHYEIGRRLLAEMGMPTSGVLETAWRRLSAPRGATRSAGLAEVSASSQGAVEKGDARVGLTPFVGRRSELERLTTGLAQTAGERRGRLVLVSGEPGVGKSRLLGEFIDIARANGATVLDARIYEAEAGQPYRPWIDALGRLATTAVGGSIARDLALLVPAFGETGSAAISRERLFGAVADLIAARAHRGPVVIVVDDIQWCDDASAALLHYVVRMNRFRPLLVLAAVREGELVDNLSVESVRRGLRREGLIEEIALAPLGAAEIDELVNRVTPGADAASIWSESRGNPLFAIELARASPHRHDGLSRTLAELIRERVGRLPVPALLTLRWASVLGRTFSVRRLERLPDLDSGELVSALEILDRHALIQVDEGTQETGDVYAFVHDLVRRAVYADLSGPRRRLMHRRVAEMLVDLAPGDGATAAEIVEHAALAGEMATAARGCVAAGRRCLRLFANTEAYAMARRGQHYAQALGEPDRLRLTIELMQIELGARRPERPEETARHLETLCEQAIDHDCLEQARLGFHMLGYLRWEGGAWSDAQRDLLRAEMVSRSADDRERVVAMAEAARCLALLERDLAQAESLLLEADALSRRAGVEPAAITAARGMLCLHRGEFNEAASQLLEARALARQKGDRLGEFQALEHLVILEMQRGAGREAARLADELRLLGDRLREGSEAPFAHALVILLRNDAGEGQRGGNGVDSPLEAAIDALRAADSKHRLAFVLTRAAQVDLRRGKAERALRRAGEALSHACALDRPSDVVLARVALIRAGTALNEWDTAEVEIAALTAEMRATLSAEARSAAEALLTERGALGNQGSGRIRSDGKGRRRKAVRTADHI